MKDWKEVEEAIRAANKAGILTDMRSKMPRGVYGGHTLHWRTREVKDLLGICIHHSGGKNTMDPIATARYHTSSNNHITPGRPLPSLCYHIAIPDTPCKTPWLCGDLSWRTYAQGSLASPGDENTHLISILVMGGFKGLGSTANWLKDGPSEWQLMKLTEVVSWLNGLFGFGSENLFGHYHFGKAACPGKCLSDWIEDRRAFGSWLSTEKNWQEALLRWDAGCLPRYGADGDWGQESRAALISFQRSSGIKVTGQQDPFTELLLLRNYPDPKLKEEKPEIEVLGCEIIQEAESVKKTRRRRKKTKKYEK